jgi:hypothetical protein
MINVCSKEKIQRGQVSVADGACSRHQLTVTYFEFKEQISLGIQDSQRMRTDKTASEINRMRERSGMGMVEGPA